MPRRRKKIPLKKPDLTEMQILAWADEHFSRFGRWPKNSSGMVIGALWERWGTLDMALSKGSRGLPGGSSVAQLLSTHRGKRNKKRLPALSVAQVLTWADEHFRKTGKWPTRKDGLIPGSGGETWLGVQSALHLGCRGFPGGSSLSRLLAKFRGVRNRKRLPHLTIPKILRWADAHRARTGTWPREKDGQVADAPGETWSCINAALREGLRGLRGGTSLFALLVRERGMEIPRQLPRERLQRLQLNL